MKRLCSLVGLAIVFAVGAAFAPRLARTPAQPTKAVALLTEVGTVATTHERVVVQAGCTLSASERSFAIALRETGFSGAEFVIRQADAAACAAALRDASDAVGKNAAFERTIGSLTASLDKVRDEVVVKLSTTTEGLSFRDSFIWIDADNARIMAGHLERAASILEWLQPRVEDIKWEKQP